MKDLIECMEVSLVNGEILSRQQQMTVQQVAEFLNKPERTGTTALVNIRGFCDAKTFVILTKGEVQAMANSTMRLAPILAFSLDLQGNGAAPADQSAPGNGKAKFAARKQAPASNGDGEKMTTPQRRYLFRLLAENMGLKANEAEEYILETCAVASLKDIGKLAASQMIDQLLNGGD